MLHYSILIVLLFLVGTQAYEDEREKRQIQIRVPIQFISDGPGLETSLFYEGERLVRLNGEGTMRMDLAINATFVCDIDGTDISMCSSITGPLVPPSAPEADIIRSGSVAYTGPGCLYSDPNNVLFIDIDQICNIIESNRPNFPTIIPPVEIMVTSRAMPDRLALNIDDTNAPDNVANAEDDIIDLTGSTSRTFASSDFSLTYRDNVVTVRRGPRVVNTIENIGEFNALLQVSSPRGTRLRLTRASGSSNSFFPGPGQLVTGTNTRTGAGAAFFTDSSEVSRNINRDIVNSQLRCTIVNGVPTIQRVSDNQGLTSLSGVESLTFPSATSKAKGTSMVTISDTSGPIRTFICDDGISLACFANNQATFFSPTMTGNVSVDSGGLSVLYDEESCNVFAYPTTNTLISTLIQNCTSRATVTPAPPIRFGVERDAFGTSVFTADGAPILQPSSSRSDLVGGNEVIDYSRDSGRLTIRGREGDRAIYNGIRQFAVNTASNRLQISGSRNIINGPGNLFVDDTGQSFFTTSDSLASFIQSSATGPSRQVSVVGTVDNGATSVNLQIGNRNIFNLGPDTTERPIQDDESLIYSGNRLSTVNAMRIPSDNRVNYFPGMNLVQIVRESTGEVIRERSTPRLFSPMVRGDVPVIQSNNISLPGGGVFYRGTGGDVYLPDDSIYIGAINVLDTVGARTTITDDMGNPEDVTSLGFYNSDGSVYQVFNGSSPRTLFGPGSIYTSGGSYFYTNNRGLRQDIRSRNSRLRPPMIAFNRNTSNVRFSTNTGEFITNFPGDSELTDIPRGTVVYSGGNITINNFVFRTDIDSLTYFDGLQVQMFNASTQTEPAVFPGPGSLLIDGRRTIYSSDSRISSRIRGALNEARRSFLPPNIPSSFPSSFISKLSQVDAGFGQEVTVYDGANVDLRCTAGNANPPATIDFFFRNDSGPLMMLEQSGDVMFIDNGVNDVTLRLLVVSTDQNDFTYTCRASNSFGTTSKSTRLKVRPSVNPNFVPTFFAGRSSPGQIVALLGRTVSPILRPLNGADLIDDTNLIINRVTVGCKAEGRPKATITWVMERNGVRTQVNDSLSAFSITSTRPGNSILTIDLIEDDALICTRYICVATTPRMTSIESDALRVCPIRYDIEPGTAAPTDCSATCGIGIQLVPFTIMITRSVDDPTPVTQTITMEELPIGLVKPRFQFCQAAIPTCPEVSFEFQTGNFSDCTEFCGGGTQSAEQMCVRIEDGMVTNVTSDEECTSRGLQREVITRSCNDRPCPVYVTGDFGECSQTCRGGFRSRSLTCMEATTFNVTTDRYIFEDTEIEICTNFSRQEVPITTEPCNFDVLCPVRYFPSNFGPCDGFFCQVRDISCVNFDPSDPAEAWPANDTECEAQGLIRPHSVRSCGGQPCSFGTWRTNRIGRCSLCGIGVQQQEVFCVTPDTAFAAIENITVIEDGFCDSQNRPKSLTTCFIQNCFGRCDYEPPICNLYRRLRTCKTTTNPIVQSCCRSCPLQSTPIPPPTPFPEPATE